MIPQKLIRKTSIAGLFIALSSMLGAQVDLEVLQNPFNVEFIQPKEGVVGNNIIDIHVDNYGFVWVASLYGLKCYDGNNYKSFESDHFDSTSLADDRIYHIHEDRNGILWISTQRGLSRYNRGSENFTAFYPDSTNPNSPDNLVYYIREDSYGLLWLFTSAGLFSFDGKDFKSYKQDSILHVNPFEEYFSLWNQINRYASCWSEINFTEDKNGNIWISGTRGGLKKYDREKDRFRHYSFDPENNDGLQTNFTVSVNIDRHDTVWVSTWGGGLYKLLDEEKGIFKHYGSDPDDVTSILSDKLQQVFVSEDGDVWILGEQGFSRYNYASDDFNTYKTPFYPEPYLYENILLKMRQDESGIMWMLSENGILRYEPGSHSIIFVARGNDMVDIVPGTNGIVWYSMYNGGWLHKIDPNVKAFRVYGQEFGRQYILDYDVNAVYKDKDGFLWAGSYWSGLFFSDPAFDDISFYRHATDPGDENSLSDNMITVIFQDRENIIWVGTNNGLNRLKGPVNYLPGGKPDISFERLLHDESNPNSISHNSIEAILESSRGELWISTFNGVDILDRKTNEFHHILKDPEDFEDDGNSFQHNPTVLYEDKLGYMWIGTYYGGLLRYNMEDSSLVSYRNNPGDASSISDNCIRHITEDKWGRLWLGTLKGLNLFDRDTETFRLFGKHQGFPGEMLKGLLVDDHGNLWTSYDLGITKFVLSGDDNCLEDPVFYHFDESDGLPGPNYNRFAYFKSSTGEMYFGGNGITAFHPDSIRINTYIPPVYITSFSKNYRRMNFDQALSDIKAIDIKYKDNVFAFEFVSLNYTNPQKNQYAYMLEGFDKDWIYCGSSREAKYTNISPGTYTFRVKGSNNDGFWNEEGASVRLVVKPPWYRATAAYILYVSVIILLVYIYNRWRTYQLMKENERLDEQVKERTIVVVEQKEEIMAANAELEEQKEELEQQTEELTQQKEELQITLDRLKETQEQLIQSEKLAALGGLVAGVAHEINTPVGISVTAASNLAEETKAMAEKFKANKISKAEFKEYLSTANQSANLILANMQRTAEMVQSFKLVSADQSTGEKRRIVLRSYMEDIIRSLYPKLKGRDISINLDIDPNLEMESYPGAISQIFTNLILNSLLHGFGENEKGDIKIRTEIRNEELNINYSDGGSGISEENRKRIFEPFFTTNKKVGTGLGLHIIYNLVTQKLNGTIQCESKQNDGTKFILNLPINN